MGVFGDYASVFRCICDFFNENGEKKHCILSKWVENLVVRLLRHVKHEYESTIVVSSIFELMHEIGYL